MNEILRLCELLQQRRTADSRFERSRSNHRSRHDLYSDQQPAGWQYTRKVIEWRGNEIDDLGEEESRSGPLEGFMYLRSRPRNSLTEGRPGFKFLHGVMFAFFFPSVEGNLMKVTALEYIANTYMPEIT